MLEGTNKDESTKSGSIYNGRKLDCLYYKLNLGEKWHQLPWKVCMRVNLVL